MKYFSFGSRDFIHCGYHIWCQVDFLLKRAELFYSYAGIPLIWLSLYVGVAFIFLLFFVQNHPGVMPRGKVVEEKITLMIK